MLVKSVNDEFQESIKTVGKASVSVLSSTSGKVTFIGGNHEPRTTAVVDMAAKTCTQCCVFALCERPCHHAHAFAESSGLFKPAASQAYFEAYFAPRHHVKELLNGITALGTMYVPTMASIPRKYREDLHEHVAKTVVC